LGLDHRSDIFDDDSRHHRRKVGVVFRAFVPKRPVYAMIGTRHPARFCASMLKHLKEITGDPTLTVHGFRTTFRTWAQEETEFEEEIVEHCLHHITGDEAEKAYKRGEALKKRRVVMQAFADFATRPLGKVLSMQRA